MGAAISLQGTSSPLHAVTEGGKEGGTRDDTRMEGQELRQPELDGQHLVRTEKLEETLALLWLKIPTAT